MKKIFFIIFIFHSSFFILKAQYYETKCVAPGNPRGLNNDSDVLFASLAPPNGSNVLVKYSYALKYTLQYTPPQTIPFAFNFNGGPVTSYKISTSGYITFSKNSNTPTGPSNVALPTSTLPDSSICVWGLGPASDGGDVYTKVYGTSPNQQLWIVFWFGGNPADTNSQNVLAIVLEQTTNNIYLVDEWGGITNNKNGVYNPLNLTMGVQISNTLAYSVSASPNVQSETWTNANTDNVWYEFSPTMLPAYTPQAKMPVFEEFTQASCNPCYEAMPNLDSVMTNNKSIINPIRYHVWFPDVDCMDSATLDSVAGPRAQTYYGVPGVPYARLDGENYIYPGAIRSLEVDDASAIGSPFTVSITSATYDDTTNIFTAKAVIQAYHTMPVGLVARIIITVDTIRYDTDQSTEDPFTNSPYLLKFPQVAESMIPTFNGIVLPAFTSVGQTYNLNVSWKKNHPWSIDRSKVNKCPYDSSGVNIVVFIQNDSSKYIYQSASTFVNPERLGIKEIGSDGVGYLGIYPNPSSGDATIAFSLTQDEGVSLELYNVLGEKVYSTTEGKMETGNHSITIDGTSLGSGIYFVRFITNSGEVTKRLVITK